MTLAVLTALTIGVVVSIFATLGGSSKAGAAPPEPHSAAAAPSVADVQTMLNAFGCGAGPATGTNNTTTQSALVRFQSANGLPQSGLLDAATVSQLSNSHATSCDNRPVPAKSGNGTRIVVSQTQHYVWVINGNQVIRQMPAVLDAGSEPLGVDRVGAYCGRPSHQAVTSDYVGSEQLNYFTRFAACGYAFHQIPMRGGKEIRPEYVLGTDWQRSDGCVELTAANAQFIYNWTMKNPVSVYFLA